jgi:Leucine Rich Repeat (LRR) protein
MPATPDSRPWWSYVRFSVRTLIVLVLVIGAWLGWTVRRAQVQRKAVAAIERAGGHVAYEVPFANGQFIRPYAPFWLRSMVDVFGIDYVGHVVRVQLPPEFSDTDMVHVGRLTGPFELWLSFTKVTDAGLVHLKGLTNLSSLYLGNTQITDAGLVHLKELRDLRILFLSDTKISDAGLVHLKGLASLSDLYLPTQVTDAGLVHLKGLTNLSTLSLGQSHVTDVGVTEFRTSLPNVHISFSPGRSKALPSIESLPESLFGYSFD